MKIGLDARLFDEAGNGRYIRNLLLHLQRKDSKNQYYIFLLQKDFDKVNLENNFTKVLANIKWYGFKEQIEFPLLLNKYHLDLVHFPHFNIPIFYRRKFVVTLHDLIHQHFGMQRASTHNRLLYFIKKWGYNLVFRHAIKRSERVITVSNFVKDQLISQWGVKEGKVEVIYEAAQDSIINLADTISKPPVQPPYIFYVGNAHPHKNVEGLIGAFIKLKEDFPLLRLVLAGKDHYFWQQMKRKYNHKDIDYAGYVDDRKLVSLYKGALCYVLPSFEEGFGIPLLEAFACGCPVAASDIGVLREVGGDAALFFNPKDTTDMALVIKKVLSNQQIRSNLIEKGKKKYKQFSWDVLAKKTLEVYAHSVSS